MKRSAVSPGLRGVSKKRPTCLIHGGHALDSRETQAILRGGAPAYLTALAAAVPADPWLGEGNLCALGHVFWRSYSLCVLPGPTWTRAVEYAPADA